MSDKDALESEAALSSKVTRKWQPTWEKQFPWLERKVSDDDVVMAICKWYRDQSFRQIVNYVILFSELRHTEVRKWLSGRCG